MRIRLGLFLLILTLASFAGCHRGPKGIQRDPVHKVTGVLLVDGKPEPQIAIRCMPLGEVNADLVTSQHITKSAFTDANGKFAIGTYESGDGAPDGDYALTFQWGAISLTSATYAGDKFNGKYKDPENSVAKFTVDGGPVDLGTIELSIK